jgi:putative membrane protein
VSSLALTGVLLTISSLYALGAAKRPPHAKSIPRAASFYAGLTVLGIALLSPLDGWSEQLFSAHMVQHLMLVLLAAPLIAFGAPGKTLWLGLPRSLRIGIGRVSHHPPTTTVRHVLAAPIVVVSLHAATMWAWHLPVLYQAALREEALHATEHLTFLGTALLFWSLILPTRRKRLSHGARSLLVFATALQSGALGAILVFAGVPLYPIHESATRWGLTPLEDQQLAGAIMWVPAGAFYLGTILILLIAWFKKMERSEVEPA